MRPDLQDLGLAIPAETIKLVDLVPRLASVGVHTPPLPYRRLTLTETAGGSGRINSHRPSCGKTNSSQ